MSSASHYDILSLKRRSIKERNFSPLHHQLNFNNWVKAVLIRLLLPYKWANGYY
jgi:hypothetical protein